MAKHKNVVYLAFEDEEITIKHSSLLSSTVNKVGGQPDWPASDIKVPNCPLCNCRRPLLVQLYAPLDNSQFHRTLYVFGCLNPACSNTPKGWVCMRTQILDMQNTKSNASAGAKEKKNKQEPPQKMSWCSGADDWGDDAEEPNQNQFNRNFMNMDNFRSSGCDHEGGDTMENDVIRSMDALGVHEQNANCEQSKEHNKFEATNVCAVIEGQDSSPVLAEEPKVPERDLMALFKGNTAVEHKFKDPTLRSFFLAVEEEDQELRQSANYFGLSDHVRDLYQKYKEQNEMEEDSSTESQTSGSAGDGGVHVKEAEVYEKSVPAHGDLMFHNFLSTIQRNPGQLLRYSRDSEPLLIAPLNESIPKCQYCGRDTVAEVQILSTLIPKLQLQQTSNPAPIEYGNILVFTCLNSCWDISDHMRYESVIVQKEV